MVDGRPRFFRVRDLSSLITTNQPWGLPPVLPRHGLLTKKACRLLRGGGRPEWIGGLMDKWIVGLRPSGNNPPIQHFHQSSLPVVAVPSAALGAADASKCRLQNAECGINLLARLRCWRTATIAHGHQIKIGAPTRNC